MTNYNEGLHLCQITRQGWLETKKEPRRPMLVFAFHVLAEIHYDDDGNETLEVSPESDNEQTARLLIDVNNEVTLNYGLQKLRYAGFASETLAELDLVGREVRCVNRHEHYNGKLPPPRHRTRVVPTPPAPPSAPGSDRTGRAPGRGLAGGPTKPTPCAVDAHEHQPRFHHRWTVHAAPRARVSVGQIARPTVPASASTPAPDAALRRSGRGSSGQRRCRGS